MSFKKITENVSNITLLADQPSLSATLLKKEFDKGNETIKTAFNIQVDGLNEVVEHIASEYNNTLTYKVGDYCMYENKLYKCITEITIPESFTSSKWEETRVASEVLKTKTTTFNEQWLVAQTAGGGGTRIMIPISNPNNNEPILDIESAEMYSTSQGWKKVSSVSLAGFSETFCMLQLTAPFSITAGYNYLVRLNGTIKTN